MDAAAHVTCSSLVSYMPQSAHGATRTVLPHAINHAHQHVRIIICFANPQHSGQKYPSINIIGSVPHHLVEIAKSNQQYHHYTIEASTRQKQHSFGQSAIVRSKQQICNRWVKSLGQIRNRIVWSVIILLFERGVERRS